MSRGLLFFSYNKGLVDYSPLTKLSASLAKTSLGLPVAVVTDTPEKFTGNTIFDHVVHDVPSSSTTRSFPGLGVGSWYNSGRERTLVLSPFDRTLVLDSDLLVFNSRLRSFLDLPFGVVRNKLDVGSNASHVQYLGYSLIPICWASVLILSKGCRISETVVKRMAQVRANWQHYAHQFKFDADLYRTDYALTLATYIACDKRVLPMYDLPYVVHNLTEDSKLVSIDSSSFSVAVSVAHISRPLVLTRTDLHVMDKKELARIATNTVLPQPRIVGTP